MNNLIYRSNKKESTFKSSSKSQGGMIAFSLSPIFSFLISLNFWTDDEINLRVVPDKEICHTVCYL